MISSRHDVRSVGILFMTVSCHKPNSKGAVFLFMVTTGSLRSICPKRIQKMNCSNSQLCGKMALMPAICCMSSITLSSMLSTVMAVNQY